MNSSSNSKYRSGAKRPTAGSRQTVAALATALLITTVATKASADEVTRWNQVATDASAVSNTNPLTESRIFAILHVAIHDAVNTVELRYEPYQLKASPASTGASVEAAIAGAAHTTLVALLPDSKVSFDAALEETLRSVTDESKKAAGLKIGLAAATAILAARENDGENQTVEYIPGTKPGDYCPTPPDFKPAFVPHWGSIRPFVTESSAQFRCPDPPAVNSSRALADVEEVKAIGGSKSFARTTEQNEIARYWYENSTQGWNRIAREVSAVRQFDVWENARLFALVNLAMADGFIGGFEDKYYHRYWRPVTAIRKGGDREWLSYLPTPPVPDYPSTHTVLGAAAATVMARYFATDFISFSMTSGAPYPNITRKFWSFSEAARENGASRILCGIHFQSAVNAGYIQGERIGQWVFDHALRPANSQPAISPVVRKSGTLPARAAALVVLAGINAVGASGEQTQTAVENSAEERQIVLPRNAVSKKKGNKTSKVNIDRKGVILEGHDAVAYFTQGKAVKGNLEIKSIYQGATYLFASAESKADFDKDPAKFVPQYGGFCAYGISLGVLGGIEDPDAFVVYNSKLYLCGNKTASKEFKADLNGNIEKADRQWLRISKL